MGIVSDMVQTANGMMGEVAKSTFGSIVSGSGNLISSLATLAIIFLAINIVLQYRPMSGTQLLVSGIKLVAIVTIGLNANRFFEIPNVIEAGMDRIAGQIITLASDTSGPSPDNTIAGAIDKVNQSLTNGMNKASDNLGRVARSIMVFFVSLLMGALAAVISVVLIVPKILLTISLGLAPIFIALWMFETTSEYFKRWVQTTTTYMLYPVVVAAVLGGIVRFCNLYLKTAEVNDAATSISGLAPFIVLVILSGISVIFVPTLVSALSGMVQLATIGAAMRSLGSGMARTFGSQQFNRTLRERGATAMAARGVASAGSRAVRMAARAARLRPRP